MDSTDDLNAEANRDRRYGKPYNKKHQIPTIQRYRENRKDIEEEEEAQNREDDQLIEDEDEDTGKRAKVTNAFKNVFGLGKNEHLPGKVYDTENRHEPKESGDDSRNDNDHPPPVPEKDQNEPQESEYQSKNEGKSKGKDGGKEQQSAAEAAAATHDPRQKRKIMKHNKRQEGGREVTDPVTHLPVIIHDVTDKDLKRAPENEPAAGMEPETYTGTAGANKQDSQLDSEKDQGNKGLRGMERMYPPPDYALVQAHLVKVYRFAIAVGLGSLLVLGLFVLVTWQLLSLKSHSQNRKGSDKEGWTRVFVPVFLLVALSGAAGTGIIYLIQGWLGSKVDHIWQDELWTAARDAEQEQNSSESALPESTQWLNMLMASIWPLINPDLFTSLGDTLEDTMQASLPKLVRMVSIDDLGQGSEAFRILGVRWLPTGAAARSVDSQGKLKSADTQETSDRVDPGQGQVEHPDDNDGDGKEDKDKKQDPQKAQQQEETVDEGMEAEQGDFVNVELAFAYRARSSSKSLGTKAHNAHLMIRFFMPGNIALPVWVEMRGIVGTMRLRLQLTPDPPFFSLCTLTFLGQPKADISCIPLSRHNLNIMDLPLISSFVQSSIDAALSEYVAPKSLTLDLKQMLAGDDFKKDTSARGVIVVHVKKAYEFKEGDSGIGPLKKGSSDPYCTVSWGKFGKPMFSTRIILGEMQPVWDEWAVILVSPEELNADELLRLQIWDSDRMDADDDLGRVEVGLKQLMSGKKTKGQLHDRKDRLAGETEGEEMPGYLEWSVGYFAKTNITSEQLANQSAEPDIKTVDDLKNRVGENAERKLREATLHDETKEISQQKAQDYNEREDNLIISSRPPDDFPSGILSIQVHNITGLELEQQSQSRPKQGAKDDSDHEAEDSDDLPSSYCTIILDHSKVYRTRTKPKNGKPFFNAGTERFIRDWRTSEVVVSVRDARVHENDPLLGIVYLPLAKIFAKRSQVMDSFPLAGGIGYGRARISLVFRSVQLQLPKELLGWDYGTLEVKAGVKSSNLSSNLHGLRLRFDTGIAHGKMHYGDEAWNPKRHRKSLCLAVKQRYCTSLVLEFRKSSIGPDHSPAWAVLWLKDIPDDEERTVRVQVWSSKVSLKRGRDCTEFDTGNEKPMGELEMKVKFWRGLSGYHKGLADKGKQQDLQDVMQVLDTVDDTHGHDDDSHDENNNDGASDSSDTESQLSAPSSDDDDDNTESGSITSNLKSKADKVVNGSQDTSSEGSRGPLDTVRDYKKHRKQLHRRHRGLMQWKTARSVDWAMTKVGHTKDGVMDKFHRNGRQPGVETEA